MLVQIEKNTKQRVFLRVINGAIEMKTKEGKTIQFGYVTGKMKEIKLKDHVIENKKFQNWHIVIEDVVEGEIYDISMPRSSGAFRGIVRCLVTEQGLENLDDVKIEIYRSKTGYTNAKVFAGGQKLNWTNEPMPEVKKILISGNEMVDDTEQVNWLNIQVSKINEKCKSLIENNENEQEIEEYDDLPQ